MLSQVIAGQDAIAVGEEQVIGRGRRHALVAAAGKAETRMVVRGEGERERRMAGRGGKQAEGVVSRAVVGDHDLKAAFDVFLGLDRGQAPAQVPGPLEGRDDDSKIHDRLRRDTTSRSSTRRPAGIEPWPVRETGQASEWRAVAGSGVEFAAEPIDIL